MKRTTALVLCLAFWMLATLLVSCTGDGEGSVTGTGTERGTGSLSSDVSETETETESELSPADDGFPNEAESGGTKRY